MCGLVTVALSSEQTLAASVLKRMTDAIAHRGPDGFGYAMVDPAGGASRTWTDAQPDTELYGVLFGHRRLSIIDLTECGHQPMISEDGSLVLAYNGEIYNFLELRAELEQLGCRFRGRSDTEVLLNAYSIWGTAAFARFNGMFAFTLWDGRRKTLVAVRDRFGVKPLYVAEVGGSWLFASEIKAILAYPGAHRGFNDAKVAAYLAHCLIDNDRETLFTGVRSLEPGSFLELSDGRARTGRFWDLPATSPKRLRSKQQYVEEFRALLADSVLLRTRSDVPIGTMLSGGLDSTAITALIHEQKQAAADRGFDGLQAFHHTFSACWPGWANDEEAEVDLLCSRLGLEAHKLYPDPKSLLTLLPSVTYHLDEPFETPTALIKFMLMRAAREAGVKVVLNGHGADETLAGYPGTFVPSFLLDLARAGRKVALMREWRAFSHDQEWDRNKVMQWIAWELSPRIGRRLDKRLSPPQDNRSPLVIDAPDAPRFEGLGGGSSLLTEALWAKFTKQILPMWLRAEDRMSMAFGVESRLPFLDYRLVEFAFELPDDMKLHRGYTKYVLRMAMRDKLPDRITLNRVKRRFASPYASWFRGAWRDLVESLLVQQPGPLCRYVDASELRHRVQAYLEGDDEVLDTALLWRLLSVRLWLEQWEEPAAARASRSPAMVEQQ